MILLFHLRHIQHIFMGCINDIIGALSVPQYNYTKSIEAASLRYRMTLFQSWINSFKAKDEAGDKVYSLRVFYFILESHKIKLL